EPCSSRRRVGPRRRTSLGRPAFARVSTAPRSRPPTSQGTASCAWSISGRVDEPIFSGSFVIGLDLYEVERLLLAKRGCGCLFRRPVRYNQFGRRPEGSEHFPVISDPHRNAWLWVRGVRLQERPLPVDLDPLEHHAADERVRLFQVLFSRVG